jgi:hypothetical protein
MRKSTIKKWISRGDHLIAFLAGVVAIIGIPVVYFQLKDINTAKVDRSTQLLMLSEQELYTPTNSAIRQAIRRGSPILQEHGGRFTSEDIEDYLDVFEGLSDAYDRDRINFDMLYYYRSDDIKEAYQNKEVRAVIAALQKDDPEYYAGFMEIAGQLTEEDRETTTTIDTDNERIEPHRGGATHQ